MNKVLLGDAINNMRSPLKFVLIVAESNAAKAEYKSTEYTKWETVVGLVTQGMDALNKAAEYAYREGLEV